MKFLKKINVVAFIAFVALMLVGAVSQPLNASAKGIRKAYIVPNMYGNYLNVKVPKVGLGKTIVKVPLKNEDMEASGVVKFKAPKKGTYKIRVAHFVLGHETMKPDGIYVGFVNKNHKAYNLKKNPLNQVMFLSDKALAYPMNNGFTQGSHKTYTFTKKLKKGQEVYVAVENTLLGLGNARYQLTVKKVK